MEIANDPNVVTFRDADNMIYKPTGQEMMPIITPAFPSMNTTYAMGASQKRVVLTDLVRFLENKPWKLNVSLIFTSFFLSSP